MEDAAAELKFERAAMLRDQIQSLNSVRERQKMISTVEVDQDVIGVVRQGGDACVELFFVRKGRLVGQEAFFFDKVAGLERRRDPLRVRPPVLRARRGARRPRSSCPRRCRRPS